jgi:hypothetical protein
MKSNLKVPKTAKTGKGKIPVTFNEKQLEMIDKYAGMLGNTKAEIIRNIVINWILDKEKKEEKKE